MGTKASNPVGLASAFPPLCGLVDFVTNGDSVLVAGSLSSPGVSVLLDLIRSGAVIDQLGLQGELPSTYALDDLSAAIRQNETIRSIAIGCCINSNVCVPKLIRTLVASLSPRLERLAILGVELSPGVPFSNALGQCTSLGFLEVVGCRFIRTDAYLEFISGIGRAKSLELVSLVGNELEERHTEELACALSGLLKLRTLELTLMEVEGATFGKKVSPDVLCKLQNLCLSGNSLGNGGITAIVDEGFVPRPTCALQSLSVTQNQISPAGATKLAQLVERAPGLRLLYLSGNTIGPAGAAQLGNAIKHTCAKSLKGLDLSDCEIGQEGTAAVLKPLCGNCMLAGLRLSGDSLGDLGATAVTEYLLAGKTSELGELALTDNQITETGALELAKGIARVAMSLKALALDGNMLGPHGGAAVIDALIAASATKLEILSLTSCFVGDEGAAATGRMVMSRECGMVNLIQNAIHATGTRAIVDAVCVAGVDALDLRLNPVGDEGAVDIAERIIKKSEKVMAMNLFGMTIGESGARALLRAKEERDKSALRGITVMW